MAVKGVAVAVSDHSADIRKLLLAEFDVVEFDPLQIIAQEMVTPILLRLGMPIDCLDYTSGAMLFKPEHLRGAAVGEIYSPRSLVRFCLKVVEQLPSALRNALSHSIDLGQPRLVVTDHDSLANFYSLGYIVIDSHRDNEVAICTSGESYLIFIEESLVDIVAEVLDRNKLIPRKFKAWNDISVHGKNLEICGVVMDAFRQAEQEAKLSIDHRRLRSLWITSTHTNAYVDAQYDANYDFCLLADGSIEQIKAAALSLLYIKDQAAYVKASDF